MVPQQQGNRMLAHGIDRLENCMELLEESNGNKRPGQASKDSLASPASFLASSFFSIMIEQIEHCSSESRSFSDVLCRRNVMTKWPQPFLLKKQLTCCWTNRRHLRCGETDTSSLTKICWAHSSFPPQQVFWDKVYKPPEAFKENKAGLSDERHCQASKCFERT